MDFFAPADDALLRLLAEAFGIPGYASGFPHVFSSENKENVFVRRGASGSVVSACAGWPLRWTDPALGDLIALCVGSVCTEPGSEGQGHASAVLAEALEAVHHRGFDAVCLFSEKRRLYENAGFVNAGKDAFVFLHPQANGHGAAKNNAALVAKHANLVKTGFARSRVFNESPACTLFALSPDAPARFADALCGFEATCAPGLSRIDAAELHVLLQIPSLSVRWLDRAGQIEAVCFVGKGHDFDNVMHGMAARTWDDALFLLGESFAREPDCTVTLLVESFESECARTFTVAKSDAVSFMVKAVCSDAARAEAVFAAFRSRRVRVRGLQSC